MVARVGHARRYGAAAALAALVLTCAGGTASSQSACSVVSSGPASGKTWAERRKELVARSGFAVYGAGTTLAFAPGRIGYCGAAVAQTPEVRYRLRLIAPVWERYGTHIRAAAARHGVPAELILSSIIEESGGRADAIVRYPGYVSDGATPSKISVGLGQMLLSSAQRLAPERRITRASLLDPAIAIDLIARYDAHFYVQTGFHPALIATAFQYGNVRTPPAGQRWHPPNPRYVQSYSAVFHASVAYLAAQPSTPAESFAALLAH